MMGSMRDTYRGYEVPEVIQVDEYYWIVDDKFGQHKGYTPEVARSFWENRVDTEIIRDAINMDLLERTSVHDLLACLECGSFVFDVFKHLEWHRAH